MMSFRGNYLGRLALPVSSVWLVGDVAEAKGRQALYLDKSPEILTALRETALVQSVESSNRIEGVTVAPERLRPLVLENDRPRDRSEEEIQGYRRALELIHAEAKNLAITPELLQRLHATIQEGSGDAGQWKQVDNEIIELREGAPPLVAVAALVFDFLCIHPFRDGNGRISRLLTLLALYQHGYEVGRYVSLERLIEESQSEYYDVLHRSSDGWHEGRHDLIPWLSFFLAILKRAYRELDRLPA